MSRTRDGRESPDHGLRVLGEPPEVGGGRGVGADPREDREAGVAPPQRAPQHPARALNDQLERHRAAPTGILDAVAQRLGMVFEEFFGSSGSTARDTGRAVRPGSSRHGTFTTGSASRRSRIARWRSTKRPEESVGFPHQDERDHSGEETDHREDRDGDIVAQRDQRHEGEEDDPQDEDGRRVSVHPADRRRELGHAVGKVEDRRDRVFDASGRIHTVRSGPG